MESAASVRFLHVANGTSTTETIEAAGIPGNCSIWADPLYEGPVPAELSDAELMEVRRTHLDGPPDPTRPNRAQHNPLRDARNDLRLWRAVILRHDAYDELILWFEHLFDQLNVIQLISWIADNVPAEKRVSLVCIGSFPGRPGFKGLGELAADEIASLLDTRQPITVSQQDLARRAWQAFREPTPEALDALRRNGTSPLPYLAAAITRFLQEYPWTRDGLSRTERRLLQLADSSNGISLQRAFPRMHEGEQAYYVTDRSLATLAETLSCTSPPLLTLSPSEGERPHIFSAIVSLTSAGHSVLAGRQDRITACGIDRWLGGVHLQPGRRIWRWDDARQRIA
jgi:hypothetical protein